jgi:hypothetical protein
VSVKRKNDRTDHCLLLQIQISRLQDKRGLPDVISGTAQLRLASSQRPPRVAGMPSPNHRGEDLSWKPASSREMQAPNSRVPPAKSRDSVQKQRSNVWNGPSPIATFVRCLRLLDLDLLEDWPGISEHTFSTLSAKQNLQARIKCVEWSLFRLFELWSSSETRDVWRKGV